MTRDEILALEGRELDKAVAVSLMGFEPVPDGSVRQLRGPGWYRNLSDPTCFVSGFEDYSSDANAARLVLAEVERRGKVKEYTLALCSLKGYEPDEYWTPIDIWRMMTATPAQICRAALLAVEGV